MAPDDSNKNHYDVLVVDDDPVVLELLTNFLGEEGYAVLSSSSGVSALEALEQAQPDLVLLDVRMPVMDGFEVCRRLKAQEATRDTPVIFISGLRDAADRVRGLDAGGVDFVSKPVSFEEVGARVRTQLALLRSRAQLEASYRKLSELEALRDGLVHKMVHDMRSPLFAITAALELLRFRSGDKLDQRSLANLDAATSSAAKLRRMIDDVEDISGLDSQQVAQRSALADVGELTQLAAATISDLHSDWDIVVDADEAAPVTCDRELVLRVIENFLVNGVTLSPPGDTVTVTCRASDGGARVSVKDRGSPIPADAAGSIFERFGGYRTYPLGQYGNVGMGLSFCKLVVDAHGGEIGVESAEGAGNTFWFWLPGNVAE